MNRRTYDPSLSRFAYLVRRELGGEIEGHEVLDRGVDRLQLVAVLQCLLSVDNGRLGVGLRRMGGDETQRSGEVDVPEEGRAMT